MTTRSAPVAATHTPVSPLIRQRVAVFGVTGHNSYEFSALRAIPGQAPEFNTLTFLWYDRDPAAPGLEIPSHGVAWTWMTDEQLQVEGPHRGPFMEVLLTPTSGMQAIDYTVAHSDRVIEEPRGVVEGCCPLDAVFSSVPVGGAYTADAYARTFTGQGLLALAATTQKGSFRVSFGGAAFADVDVDPADPQRRTVFLPVTLPRATMSVRVRNNGTAPAAFSARLTTADA